MKKRFASMLLSLAMVISCLFAFTACGGKKDDDSSNQTPAAVTVESLLVEVVTDGLTMTENKITYAYGSAVSLSADDFKLTANYSDETTKVISLKSDTNEDGYTFASTVPSGTPTTAGSYKLTFTYSEKKAEVDVKVNKGTVDMTGVRWDYDQESPFVYNKAEQVVLIDESTLPEGVTVSYAGNTATAAGIYTATATFAYSDAANYEAIAPMTLEWEIEKADIDVSGVSLTTGGYYYNGSAVTPAVLNLPENVTATPVVEGSNTKVNAGRHEVEYAFTYNGADAENYNVIENRTLFFDIYKGTLVATAKRTLSYDGTTQTFPVSEINVPAGVTITDISNNTGIEVATYTATITVTYEEELLENYENVTTLSVRWKIVKANYIMSGVSWNYNPATPLVYNGQVQTVEITGTLPTGVTVKSYTGNSAKDANSNLVASVTFDYDTAHYNRPVFASLEWEIAKAVLTVKAIDASVPYGTLAKNTGVEYSGFVGTEDESVLDGELLYQYANYDDKNATSPVGTYRITLRGLEATNYTFDYVYGTLTVTKLTIDLSMATWNYPSPVDYDGQIHKPTINGVPTDVNVTYTYKKVGQGTPIENPKNAGSYVAEAVFGAANENYEVINAGSLQNHPFTINKVALTITINNKETFYQQEAPAFDAEYVGFVTGEDENVLLGQLIVLCSYQVGNPVGTYDIINNGSTLTSENYVIEIVAGQLEVKKAIVDLSKATWETITFEYTGEAHKPTVSGLPVWVVVEYSYLSGDGDMFATSIENPIDAGEYIAFAVVEETSNYSVSGEIAETAFVIEKATLTLKVDDATISYYDEYNPTTTYYGFIGADSVLTENISGDYSFDYDYVEGSNVGTYVVSVSGDLSSTNYEIEYADGTLVVETKVINANEFAWTKANEYVYNSQANPLPYLNNVPSYVQVEYVYNDGTNDVQYVRNAGEYTVTAVFGDGEGNWSVSGTVSTTFKILKATIDGDLIYWDAELDLQDKVVVYYDGNLHTLELVNNTGIEFVQEYYEIPGLKFNALMPGKEYKERGLYHFGVTLSLREEDKKNYNDFEQSYYAILLIDDYIETYNLSYFDIETETSDILSMESFGEEDVIAGLDNKIVTNFGYTLAQPEQMENFNIVLYSDITLNDQVTDLTDIRVFEKELYIGIFRNTGDSFELFEIRRLIVSLNFTLETNEKDEEELSIYKNIVISNEPLSFKIENVDIPDDTKTFSITPIASESLEYSKIALWNSTLATPAYGAFLNSVNIEFGVNRAKWQFAYMIGETIYYYEKEISIVKSADSDYYCDVYNNKIETGYDVTEMVEDFNPYRISINPGFGFVEVENSREIQVVNGSHYLVVQYRPKTDNYSVVLYDAAEVVTIYIRLILQGTIDTNFNARIDVEGENGNVDYSTREIHVTAGSAVNVKTENNRAKILYTHEVGVSDFREVQGNGYIVFNFEGTYVIRILSTYYVVNREGNPGALNETWTEYTVYVSGGQGGNPGGGMPEHGNPSDTSFKVDLFDIFGNRLNTQGELDEDAVVTPEFDEESGYYLLELSDWNETKYINVHCNNSFASVTIAKTNDLNEDGEITEDEVEILDGPIYLANFAFREAGVYYVVIVSEDTTATSTMIVMVSGEFAPFIEIEANDVTATEGIDKDFNLSGDFVYWLNSMTMAEINLEAYVGEVDGLEFAYEISINSALEDYLYLVSLDTGLIDTESKIELNDGKVTLDIFEDENGFPYVKFAIYNYDEEFGMEVTFYIWVFFCDKYDRLNYNKITIGEDSFDFKLSTDRYGDFGDVQLDYDSGLPYVMVDETCINPQGKITVSFDTYEGYELPQDSLEYLILTKEAMSIIESAYENEEISTFEELSDLVETLIFQGLAARSNSMSIQVEVNEYHYAAFYIFAEGANAENFEYIEEMVAMFEVRIDGLYINPDDIGGSFETEMQLIEISYGTDGSLTEYADITDGSFYGDFENTVRDDEVSVYEFEAHIFVNLEPEQTEFELTTICLDGGMFEEFETEDGGNYVVIEDRDGNIIEHTNLIASSVTLIIDSSETNSVSFTVKQYEYEGLEKTEVVSVTFVIYLEEVPSMMG